MDEHSHNTEIEETIVPIDAEKPSRFQAFVKSFMEMWDKQGSKSGKQTENKAFELVELK